MIKKYNKLIRDRILEIIKDAGERPYHRILSRKEFQQEIKKKILEEAKELAVAEEKDEIIDELVDLQELIDVLAFELKLSKFDIKQEQGNKNQKRGGFKKRLFLIKTIK